MLPKNLPQSYSNKIMYTSELFCNNLFSFSFIMGYFLWNISHLHQANLTKRGKNSVLVNKMSAAFFNKTANIPVKILELGYFLSTWSSFEDWDTCTSYMDGTHNNSPLPTTPCSTPRTQHLILHLLLTTQTVCAIKEKLPQSEFILSKPAFLWTLFLVLRHPRFRLSWSRWPAPRIELLWPQLLSLASRESPCSLLTVHTQWWW